MTNHEKMWDFLHQLEDFLSHILSEKKDKELEPPEENIKLLLMGGSLTPISNAIEGANIDITQESFTDKEEWAYNTWSNLFIQYDVVLFPSGSGTAQFNGLGENGQEAIKDYIFSGGNYIGICAGGFLASGQRLGISNVKYVAPYFVGKGDLEINMEEFASNIFVSSEYQYSNKRIVYMENGPLWEIADLDRPPVTVIASFTNSQGTDKYEGDTFKDYPAIIRDKYGRGNVVLFSIHPELSSDLENQNMLLEAIKWQVKQKTYWSSLTEDFIERDKLPETDSPRERWFSTSDWASSPATYPTVHPPNIFHPVEWKRDRIIEVAKKYIGVPYMQRKIPTLGMDCSNYTSWVYNYGLGIHFTSGIEQQAETVGVKLEENEPLQKGDLLFTYSSDGTRISHVMIYIDENIIIDSTVDSVADGVAIRPFESWYKSQFAFARRIIK